MAIGFPGCEVGAFQTGTFSQKLTLRYARLLDHGDTDQHPVIPMEELLNEPCLFSLNRDGGGVLYLEVECGTTAVFLVKLRLSSEEKAEFEKRGASFITDLAWSVRDRPDHYLKRKVS